MQCESTETIENYKKIEIWAPNLNFALAVEHKRKHPESNFDSRVVLAECQSMKSDENQINNNK
eukprot:3148307-Karenia_brevis.AAC.1